VSTSQLLQRESKVGKNAKKKHKQEMSNFRDMLESCSKSKSSNLLRIEDVLEVKLYELALVEREAWPELFAGHGEALQVADDVQEPTPFGGAATPVTAEHDGPLHGISVRTNTPALSAVVRQGGGLTFAPNKTIIQQALSALTECCRLHRSKGLTESGSTDEPKLIMRGRLSADCQRCNFDADAAGPDGMKCKLERVTSHNQHSQVDALYQVDLLLRNFLRWNPQLFPDVQLRQLDDRTACVWLQTKATQLVRVYASATNGVQ